MEKIIEKEETKKCEARIRRLAQQHGYYIQKSREQYHYNNKGLYQLVLSRENRVVMGLDFDSSLNEIEHYLLGKY